MLQRSGSDCHPRPPAEGTVRDGNRILVRTANSYSQERAMPMNFFEEALAQLTTSSWSAQRTTWSNCWENADEVLPEDGGTFRILG